MEQYTGRHREKHEAIPSGALGWLLKSHVSGQMAPGSVCPRHTSLLSKRPLALTVASKCPWAVGLIALKD